MNMFLPLRTLIVMCIVVNYERSAEMWRINKYWPLKTTLEGTLVSRFHRIIDRMKDLEKTW